MADLDMDAAAPPLHISHAPSDVITVVMSSMSLHGEHGTRTRPGRRQDRGQGPTTATV